MDKPDLFFNGIAQAAFVNISITVNIYIYNYYCIYLEMTYQLNQLTMFHFYIMVLFFLF